MRIRELRKSMKMNQVDLAKKINTTQSNISGWENDRWQPDNNTLIRLSNIFNCSIDYILGLDNNKNSNIVNNRIPVLGKIPAGIPLEMIEDILDYEEINPDMLRGGKEYFALKVTGESMSPKFLEGDILIVRKQSSCENGEYAIVAVNGYDATFKKVIKKENCIILQPLNSSYEPMIYTNEDIEKLPVRVLGVVVEIRRSI